MRWGELLTQALEGLRQLEATIRASGRAPAKPLGPVKWCARCSRRHRARAGCGLVLVAVPAKSGRMVNRWVHPAP